MPLAVDQSVLLPHQVGVHLFLQPSSPSSFTTPSRYPAQLTKLYSALRSFTAVLPFWAGAVGYKDDTTRTFVTWTYARIQDDTHIPLQQGWYPSGIAAPCQMHLSWHKRTHVYPTRFRGHRWDRDHGEHAKGGRFDG